MDLALEYDVIQKSGSFFSYGELRLGQGRNNTKQFLAENPEPAAEIEAKVFEALGIDRPSNTKPAAEAEAEAEPAAEAEELEKAA